MPLSPSSQTACSYQGPGLHKCARPPTFRPTPVSYGVGQLLINLGQWPKALVRGVHMPVCQAGQSSLGTGRLSGGKGLLWQRHMGAGATAATGLGGGVLVIALWGILVHRNQGPGGSAWGAARGLARSRH